MIRRRDAFNFEAFEQGTARKIRFDSEADMETWRDQIREVRVELVLEWDNLAGVGNSPAESRTVNAIGEQIAE